MSFKNLVLWATLTSLPVLSAWQNMNEISLWDSLKFNQMKKSIELSYARRSQIVQLFGESNIAWYYNEERKFICGTDTFTIELKSNIYTQGLHFDGKESASWDMLYIRWNKYSLPWLDSDLYINLPTSFDIYDPKLTKIQANLYKVLMNANEIRNNALDIKRINDNWTNIEEINACKE